MPSISEHHSTETTKLLFLGESGSGKTGALASLAAAGYNLRIIDGDNGLDILRDYATNPKSKYLQESPGLAARIEFRTIQDKMTAQGGKIFPTAATAWPIISNMLENWKYEHGGKTIDLGKVTSWGPQDILVIDTLTSLSLYAYHYILSLNGQLMNQPTGYDYQRKIGAAQGLVENLLELLSADAVKCNVIVNSHVLYIDEPGTVRQNQEEVLPKQGFPTTLGRALSPRVPRRFNTTLMAKKVGIQHQIFVRTTSNVNLKSSAPLKVADSYPLATGLAEYFKAIRS